MSLASIITHYRPFIRKHKKSVFLLVLGNVIQAIFIVIINTSFNLFFGLLVSGVYTPVGLCLALGQYLGSVAVLTFAAGINSYIGDKLIHSLNQEVTHSLLDRWMKTKAYFGANFIQSPKVINPAGALSYDIQESNRLAIRLGDNLLNTFFAFLAGLYGLWQLSFPLTFELGTLLFVIPGYLAIGALVYAVVYNIIASKIGYKLKDLTERNHTFFNKLEAQVHHVDKHAEGIELLKAAPYEKKKIDKILNKSTLSNTLISKLQGALIAFTALNEHLRFFAGILLSYPQILANKMTVDVLISVGDYFTRVAYFPSWKYEKYEDVTNLEVYIGKINALKAQIDDWNQIQQMNKLEITKGKTLSFKDLLVTKPDQSVILKSKEFYFKNGQLTLIQGPSGIGKSTLFRVMTQLWPYVKGKMTLPCEPIEVHVIPQKIVFPLNSTLYEAIHYPLDVAFKDLSLAQRQEMDALLLEFKLDKSVIEKASEKRDWSKILSGGEQQRIALIRAIVHKPKLLLMDEPYSALDPTLHEHCEKALLKYLKPYKTTIILIDHRSENQAQKSDGNRLRVDSVNFRNKMLTR